MRTLPATLLYFFPAVERMNAHTARDVYEPLGLWPALEGTNPDTRYVLNGPGGHDGLLVIAKPHHVRDPLCVYRPNEQAWEECAGFWIGHWTDRRPGPEDLSREVHVDGHFVTLCDGNRWRIPLARQIGGATALPEVVRLDRDGRAVRDVHPKYAAFYRMGEELFDRYMAEQSYASTIDDMVALVTTALQVNYHVGRWEASALRLLDTQSWKAIAEAIIDMPTVYAWAEQKKNEDASRTGDGSSSSDGREAI